MDWLVVTLFALPWIAAIAWIGFRAGWWYLSADSDEPLLTQAGRLRSFGGR